MYVAKIAFLLNLASINLLSFLFRVIFFPSKISSTFKPDLLRQPTVGPVG